MNLDYSEWTRGQYHDCKWIPPCFVWQHYLWNIALQPSVGCYNVWADLHCSGCSPPGEKSLWNGTTAMLAPSLVWEVLWDISSSCLIKQKCCYKFQNGKIDNFTMYIILLQWWGIFHCCFCVLMNYIQRYTHFIIQHCFLICHKYRLKMTSSNLTGIGYQICEFGGQRLVDYIYVIVWYWNYGRSFRIKECQLLIEWSIGLCGRVTGIRLPFIICFL